MTTYVFPRVLDELMRREGQEVTLPTLVTLTGFEERQIQNAIANARRSDDNHAARIEVIKLGKAWRFDSRLGSSGEDTVDGILEDVKMGSTHIWKLVLAAIATRPGETITKDEIAQLVNEQGDHGMTPDRVVGAMITIMRKPLIGPHVEVIQVNRAWRYTPPKTRRTSPVSTSIRGSILRYFNNSPGATHFAVDIADDLGFTVQQVQSSMYYTLTSPNSLAKDDFEVIEPGHAWRYVPNRNRASSNGKVTPAPAKVPVLSVPVASQPEVRAYTPQAVTTTLPVSSTVPNIPAPQPVAATTKRTFEEVMTSKTGAIIIKDEEGTLYRATELDLDA